MSHAKTRKRVKVLGMLDPDRMYTTAGLLKHSGIGDEKRRAMRASGIVTPITIGTTQWYRGSEVIAWIESQAK